MQSKLPIEVLRENGLRVTAIRMAVLESLTDHAHLPAEEVLELVRSRLGTASMQSVYDTLHTLTDAGIVNEIEPAGHPARYELRVGDNHHHMICRICGRIEDVDCSVGISPCLAPTQQYGFVLEVAEVTYWGVCPLCAAQQVSS